MVNYSNGFNGGLVDDQDKKKSQDKGKSTTMKAICTFDENSFEEYLVSFGLESEMHGNDKQPTRQTCQLNPILYKVIYRLYMDSEYHKKNVTLFTTALMSKGIRIFREYVPDDDIDVLLKSSLLDIIGLVNKDFKSKIRSDEFTIPAYTFKSLYYSNWNPVDAKSVSGHYYNTDNIDNFLSRVGKFGFEGKDGNKWMREFILMTGLRSSTTIQKITPIHEKLQQITQDTIDEFCVLIKNNCLNDI